MRAPAGYIVPQSSPFSELASNSTRMMPSLIQLASPLTFEWLFIKPFVSWTWAQEWHLYENCEQRVQLTPGYREFPSFRKASPRESQDGWSLKLWTLTGSHSLLTTSLPQPYRPGPRALAVPRVHSGSAMSNITFCMNRSVLYLQCPIQQHQAPRGYWTPQLWLVQLSLFHFN